MSVVKTILKRAKAKQKHIVLPEGNDIRIIEAATHIVAQSIAQITLLGEKEQILALAKEKSLSLSGIEIKEPAKDNQSESYAEALFEIRKNRGMTLEEAQNLIKSNSIYFATMMVHLNEADGLVAGSLFATADVLRPALQIIRAEPGISCVSSCFLMEVQDKLYGDNGVVIFTDCAVIPQPSAEQLADIAIAGAKTAKDLLDMDPKVAMLSFSTKGSGKHELVDKVVKATDLVRQQRPDISIDGELQADSALVPEVANLKCPDSPVAGKANVLVFPDLQSGNIGYKLVQRLGNALAVGPILQGIAKPVNDLSRGASVEDIINMVAITCVQCK